MADNVTNEFVLEHLKTIRAEIGTLQSDMSDVKASLTNLRQHLNHAQAAGRYKLDMIEGRKFGEMFS